MDFLFHESYFDAKMQAVSDKWELIENASVQKYADKDLVYFENNPFFTTEQRKRVSDLGYLIENRPDTFYSAYVPDSISDVLDFEHLKFMTDLYDYLFPWTIILIVVSILFYFLKFKIYLFTVFLTLLAMSIWGYYYFIGEKEAVDNYFKSAKWEEFSKKKDSESFVARYREVYVSKSNYNNSNYKTYTIDILDESTGIIHTGTINFDGQNISDAYYLGDNGKVSLDLEFSGNRQFSGYGNDGKTYRASFK